MQIAVLSDTHIRPGKTLSRFVWDHLGYADLILHAGDLTNKTFYEELSLLAPVKAVCGNCDDWDVNLPNKECFICESVKIGLIHGHQGKGNTTLERAFNSFERDLVDVIVFGHSHSPVLERHNGVLMFNPGSPTEKRREAQYTFGWLDIQMGQIQAKHIYF